MSQQIRNKRAAALAGDPVARGSLLLAALLTLVFAIAGAVIAPSMYSDSAFGFRIWDSMRHGAAFNHLIFPDPANIARDTSTFETTWTPGQYVFPGLLEWLGLNLGLAIMVVVAVAAFACLWGWYALYRALGFSERSAALTVLLIAASRHFSQPFGIYNGGEMLLLAAAPWAFLLVWRLRELPWTSVPTLLAAIAGLVFMKLSGIIFAGAAISAAVVSAGRPWFTRQTLRKALVATIILGLAAALFYYAWLSRGWTAMSGAVRFDWSKLLGASAFTVSNVWSGMFSFGSLIDYVFLFPGHQLLSSGELVNDAMVVPALATLGFVWRRLRHSHIAYLRFALLAAAAMAAFFVLTWARGSDVSMEERHFRPISMLLLVGVVEAFRGARNIVLKGLFVTVAGLSGVYGLASYANHARTNLADPLGARGFRLHIARAGTLAYLRTIDRFDADGTPPLIYVPSPEIGLELRHARVIAQQPNFEDEKLLASRVVHGRVPRLYILLQTPLVANGKADVILRTFVDYPADGWKKTTLGDFVVFSSTP